MKPVIFNHHINSRYNTYNFKEKKSVYQTETPFYQNKLVQAGFILGVLFLASKIPCLKNIIKTNKKTESAVKNLDVFVPSAKPEVINPPKVDKIKKKNYTTDIFEEEIRISKILSKMRDIWCKDGFVSPEGLDKILTTHVGKKNKREIKFHTNPARGVFNGRKIAYNMPHGKVFMLESHTTRFNTIETRCYVSIVNGKPLTKENRLYLCPDGIFEQGAYFARKTHLSSSGDAINWINAAKNPNSARCARK